MSTSISRIHGTTVQLRRQPPRSSSSRIAFGAEQPPKDSQKRNKLLDLTFIASSVIAFYSLIYTGVFLSIGTSSQRQADAIQKQLQNPEELVDGCANQLKEQVQEHPAIVDTIEANKTTPQFRTECEDEAKILHKNLTDEAKQMGALGKFLGWLGLGSGAISAATLRLVRKSQNNPTPPNA